MVKKAFVSAMFTIMMVDLFAQKMDNNEFNKLLNNKRIVYFDKANNRYFGCGLNIDCKGLDIDFKAIYFDKVKKRLTISGFVNPISRTNGDTIGSNIFKIFVAKPLKGQLKSIRVIADVENSIKEKSRNTSINLQNFSFATDFDFSKGDCLYIEGGELFRLNEYCISELLK